MVKLYKFLFFMLLIFGIEKYGFSYEFEAKEVKPTEPSPKSNQATASQPTNGYLSSKISSLWSSKPQETISARDQQAAKEFDAISIPDEAQTQAQLLELQRQQNFLQNSPTQQIDILNTTDSIQQQQKLDAPVQKSSGWSFFTPRAKLSRENLQNNKLSKPTVSDSATSDTASISSADSLDLSETSQKTNATSPSPIMDSLQNSYQWFMNKANDAVINTSTAVTSVKDAMTVEPVAPVRTQVNYTPEYRPGQQEMLDAEYTTFKNAREKAKQEAKAAGKPFSFPDFATFTDQRNQELYTSSTPTTKSSWSKTASQDAWEAQHQLYQTN
jgi:hypothetical protein